jgi:hypothetical protein
LRFFRVGFLHRFPTLRPFLIDSNESLTFEASDRLKLIVVPVLTVLPDAFGSFVPLRNVVRESLSRETVAVLGAVGAPPPPPTAGFGRSTVATRMRVVAAAPWR